MRDIAPQPPIVSESESSLKKKIVVIFLIHNAEVWGTLEQVYRVMANNIRFTPIVISINRKYPSGNIYTNEKIVHELLESRSIPHRRFTGKDSFQDLEKLVMLKPDVIFRQSIWANDVPPAFTTKYLRFAKLCNVPYFVMPLIEHDASYLGFEYSRQSSNNFVLNDSIKLEYARASGDVAIAATGHPKIDEILSASAKWHRVTKNFKVMSVAHHAIFDDWIDFGVLPRIYHPMLRFAKMHPDIDFMFSPHPGMKGSLERLQRENQLLAQNLTKFYEQWDELENTSTLLHGGGVCEMKASDMLLIDSVSMLAEYQVLDKPIVFMERKDHAPFNRFGKRIAPGARIIQDLAFTSIEESILHIKNDGQDDAKDQRKRNKAFLTKYLGAANRITERVLFDFGN